MASINRRKQLNLRTHEGAPARPISPNMALRRSVMSCLLWEREFYEDGQNIADRILDLVGKVSAEEAACIAIEARTQYHLRHVPLLICIGMLKHHSGPIISSTIEQVIQRADELAEIYALASQYFPDKFKSLSQLKKGVALAFHKFDAYDFGKYKCEGKTFTVRDAMFLSHPIPQDEELFKMIADQTLPTPDTWETALSRGDDKQGTWIRMIAENQLGGLALLRNLRNMQQVDVPDSIIAEGIRRNKFNRVLPFRFIAAAKYAPDFEPELEEAMFRVTNNLPKFKGRTLLLIDHSGSMDWSLSSRSDMTRFNAACALAMILRELCSDLGVYCFSQEVVKCRPRRGFALRDEVRNCMSFNMTNLGSAVAQMNQESADRLIVITDEQSHDRVPSPIHKHAYMINVASHENGVGYYQWTHIDGFSENIIRFISEVENEGA